MKLLLVLMFLGLSCAQYAQKCKKPVPMQNFQFLKYTGAYFLAAFDAMNPLEAAFYSQSRCGMAHVHVDQGHHKHDTWELNLLYGSTLGGLSGTYSLPDYNVGSVDLFYRARNFTYTYTVMCTDYVTWSAGYVCAEVTPEYTSEFVILYVRDMKYYTDDLISSPEVQECFKDATSKPIKDWTQMPFHDCPDII